MSVDLTLPLCDANHVERAALAGTCRSDLKPIACELNLMNLASARDIATMTGWASAIGGAARNCSSGAWCKEIASRTVVHDDSASPARCPCRASPVLVLAAVPSPRDRAQSLRAHRCHLAAAPPTLACVGATAIFRCCSAS